MGAGLDRTERVSDLVSQPGGHLAQRREPVTLLHALIVLGVFKGDRGLGSEAPKELNLFGGERIAQSLVPDGDQSIKVSLVSTDRHADRSVHGVEHLNDLEERLIQRRTTWIFVVTLAITVLTAVFAEPWRGEQGCVFCGTVPSATVGVQFGAVSGIVLLWQLRRRKAIQ